jgi:hypothetical protein
VVSAIVTVPAAAQPRRGVRQVQLIAMGGMQAPPAGPGNGPAAQPASLPATMTSAPEIPGFAVHDLSRRYVEYRMANELRGGVESPAPPPVDTGIASPPPLIAAASPISVPFWMQPTSTVPSIVPTIFTPGCGPAGYRPSGILGREAEARRAGLYAQMSAIACEHGIPVGLFDAVIMRESRYDPAALSPKRAYGLTQLMPATADGLGVNRFDIIGNLRGGARYLREQLDHFGQVHLALAAYNAGPGRVRGGRIPRIAETEGYVANILTNWSRLSWGGRVTTVQATSPRASALPAGMTRVSMTTF